MVSNMWCSLKISASLAICAAVLGFSYPARAASACENYSVIVNVRDSKHALLPGLTPADFVAKVRGHVVPVLSVQTESGPRRKVILLDVSGSMTEIDPHSGNKWEAARTLVRMIVESAPAEDRMALVTFSTEAIDSIALSQSRTEIIQRLDSLADPHKVTPKDKLQTSLLDMIEQAAEQLKPTQAGDAVYIVSDGEDDFSHVRLKQVQETLLSLGIRSYFFEVPSYYRYSDIEKGTEDFLRLSSVTGGYNMRLRRNLAPTEQYDLGPKARAAMENGVRYMHDQTTHYYRLELDGQYLRDKMREWNLEIVNNQARRREDFEVIYSHELLPCQGQAHP